MDCRGEFLRPRGGIGELVGRKIDAVNFRSRAHFFCQRETHGAGTTAKSSALIGPGEGISPTAERLIPITHPEKRGKAPVARAADDTPENVSLLVHAVFLLIVYFSTQFLEREYASHILR